ncbi:MAG: lysophospholipase [Prevotellaceae bacterium]|jgi:pimeloyl-ACP methyl ester carboxylesterase|nr:lysophospholipase [Prevotellaceae bacterium]
MKKLLVLFAAIVIFQLSLQAQYDNMFYYPRKGEKVDHKLPSHEDIYLEADQDTLHSIFVKPKGKPIATIFYIHGNSGNITIYDDILTALVNGRFQVFITDFRGYGKSSGTPTHLNIAKDGQMVFDYLISRTDVRNTKLIVYGASIGTQLAAKLAKDNQDKVSALVLEDGMSSFTDMALITRSKSQHDLIRKDVTSPYSSKEDIAQIENTPKLIMHAKNDRVVPFTQGQEVFENAKEPKLFLETENGHLEVMQKDPRTAIAKIKELIK